MVGECGAESGSSIVQFVPDKCTAGVPGAVVVPRLDMRAWPSENNAATDLVGCHSAELLGFAAWPADL